MSPMRTEEDYRAVWAAAYAEAFQRYRGGAFNLASAARCAVSGADAVVRELRAHDAREAPTAETDSPLDAAANIAGALRMMRTIQNDTMSTVLWATVSLATARDEQEARAEIAAQWPRLSRAIVVCKLDYPTLGQRIADYLAPWAPA